MGLFKIKDGEAINQKRIKYAIVKDGKESHAEETLESLLFTNPKIFPVDEITGGEAGDWIPLARQISLKNHHGTLDIIATDDVGNIYIVECKLKYNTDMKTIRSQLTNYVSGFWSESNKDFDKFWEWFCNVIQKTHNKKLEEILKEHRQDPDEIDKIINSIKKNFNDDKIFLIYAVDHIAENLREAVDWHNKAVNPQHNYPSFVLEAIKYSIDDTESEVIVTQNFPSDLSEIYRKTNSSRKKNETKDWEKLLDETELDNDHRNKIKEFAEKLIIMLDKDGGEFGYGDSVKIPQLMPKFKLYSKRAPITVGGDGILAIQSYMFGRFYADEYQGFKNKISEIDEIKNAFENSKSTYSIKINSKIWVPHREKILSILQEMFVDN